MLDKKCKKKKVQNILCKPLQTRATVDLQIRRPPSMLGHSTLRLNLRLTGRLEIQDETQRHFKTAPNLRIVWLEFLRQHFYRFKVRVLMLGVSPSFGIMHGAKPVHQVVQQAIRHAQHAPHHRLLFASPIAAVRLSQSKRFASNDVGSALPYLNIDRNPETRVVTIGLNRPAKLNALDDGAWSNLRTAFEELDDDSSCRAIVLHGGESKHFCAGIDLQAIQSTFLESMKGADAARNAYKLLPVIKRYQDALSALERCKKPVIAAVHGACIGAGIDMVCAADIRYCSVDAYFQVKEVDIGLAADVGTLQRFPKMTGNSSLARELAYTARRFYPEEAQKLGFVSRILCDRDQLLQAATDIAVVIAAKSPVAVQGTKVNLNHSRDHSVEEGLEYMRVWNMGMLQTEDLVKSVTRGAGGKAKKVEEKASDFSDV